MKRFWEIDFARGIAVILMIGFHAAFDITYFKHGTYIDEPLSYIAFFIASLFIILFGISMTISYARASKRLKGKELCLKYIRRSVKLLGYASIITIITFLAFPQEFIFFGILHFFSTATLLSYLALRIKAKPVVYLLFTLISFLISLPLMNIHAPLFSFAGASANIKTFDYFPLFPWLGVVFFGMFLGTVFYRDGKRQFGIKNRDSKVLSAICMAGRHSLLIYFIHQPVLVIFILFLPI